MPSMKAWEKSANKLRAAMPADIQEILTRCEKEGKTETPEYEMATNDFNKRHSCRLDPIPEELAGTIQAWIEDPTVEMTMFGPSDFDVTGSLKNWGVDEDLKILTPEVVPGGIMLISGYFDVAQDEGMVPFFKEPSAKVKWVRFGLSSHCPHLEETEKYIQAVGSFLED